MTADNTYHKVVNLVLLRMDSHPEEFTDGTWITTLTQINEHGTEEETAAVRAKFSTIRLDKAYEDMCMQLFVGNEEKEEEIPLVRAQPKSGKGLLGQSNQLAQANALRGLQTHHDYNSALYNGLAQSKIGQNQLVGLQNAYNSASGMTALQQAEGWNSYEDRLAAHNAAADKKHAAQKAATVKSALQKALAAIEESYTAVKKGGI